MYHSVAVLSKCCVSAPIIYSTKGAVTVLYTEISLHQVATEVLLYTIML